MSATALRPRKVDRPPIRGTIDHSAAVTEDAGLTLALRLAAFVGLYAFAAGHWIAMLTDPPAARLWVTVLIVTLGAGVLALSGHWRLGPAAAAFARFGVIAAMLIASAVAMGIEPRLLLPGGWGDLAAGIDRGINGSVIALWPYDGPDPWVRQVVALLPVIVGVACAAMAFWPGEWLARPGRVGALVALVALYTAAAAERDFGSQGARGLLLLALIAAWLWLPRMRGREAAVAASIVAAAGVLA
nr:hypothetical protein [Thermoleophilaceae bacterium]